jgi:hypothetical protein
MALKIRVTSLMRLNIALAARTRKSGSGPGKIARHAQRTDRH